MAKMDLDALNELNMARFAKGEGVYICTRCGKETTTDGSCSLRGKNLMCESCIDEIKKEDGLDFTSEVCRKYIWI